MNAINEGLRFHMWSRLIMEPKIMLQNLWYTEYRTEMMFNAEADIET